MSQYDSMRQVPSGRNSAQVPGWSFSTPLHRAHLVGHPVVEHGRHECLGKHAQLGTERAHQRLELGSEHDTVLAANEVQRLDPELVSSEEERAGRLIEQSKCKHASKPWQALRPPATPRFEDDFGVRGGGEAGTTGDQLSSDLPVVVQLAVVAEHEWLLDQAVVDHAEGR